MSDLFWFSEAEVAEMAPTSRCRAVAVGSATAAC